LLLNTHTSQGTLYLFHGYPHIFQGACIIFNKVISL
jgi:hypothetical protein